MEETKKRRRPNFFDVLFIVLILAAAALAWFLSHDPGDAVQETVSRTYLVELNGLDQGMADCVAVGDTVTDNIKNYDLGVVEAVDAAPSTVSVLDEEAGVMRQVPLEHEITLYLTIRADTVETVNSVETVSGFTLRTGASVSCTVGQLGASGYILSVERKEAA